MRKILANIQYLATPAFIGLSILGISRGSEWVWLGAALMGALVVADTLFPVLRNGTGKDAKGRWLGSPWFLNSVLYSVLPIYILQQVALAWRVHSWVTGIPAGETEFWGLPIATATSNWELAGAVLSAGIWQGMGIVYGHELSHTKGWSFVLSRWIMSLSGSANFSLAHILNHHIDLADSADAASAPRGRSLYAHFILSHVGQSAFVARAEHRRLESLGRATISLRNRWIRGYLMSIPSVALFAVAGGWAGLGILAVIWVISNFELEMLNYIEHYGLIRVPGQPVEDRHSWNNNTVLTSIFFIEISLHGDHHVRGETRFWELLPTKAPSYGLGYVTLLLIALVPPVWHAFMRSRLVAWERDFATPGERAIAQEHNARIGFIATPLPEAA